MKKLQFIAIPLSLVFLSGCVTTGDRPNLLTVEEEKRLGLQLSEQVEKEEKILEDQVIQAYIDSIGDRISRQSPRQEVEYRFTVIDSPDTVNAYALPGGHMYVYTGLMQLCANEAELAGVMAHEIAHVAAEHHGEALTREYGWDFIISLILGDSDSTGTGLAQVMKTARRLSYSRAQERESDAMGMEMLYRSGYNTDAMVDFYGKMGANQRMPEGAAGKLMTYLSTHPPTEQRVEALRAQSETYPAEERAKSPVYGDRYKRNVLDRLPKKEPAPKAGE